MDQWELRALRRGVHRPKLDCSWVPPTVFEQVDWNEMPQKVEEPWQYDLGLGLTKRYCLHFPKRRQVPPP